MSTAKDQLRRRLAERQRENAELERIVGRHRAQYRDEVAPLETEVLRRQVERLRRAAQAHMRSARLRNAYHDAQQAYEDVQSKQETDSSPPAHDLKAIYRRASKECHPDAVPDTFEAPAAATFQALEAAYQAGHAEAVQAIAAALDEWGFPTGPAQTDATRGPQELSDAVSALEASIQTLRRTDAYQAVQEEGSLDAAIVARKRELARQLRKLEQRPSARPKR